MTYVPKGNMKRLIDAMQAQPEKRWWTADEVRIAGGIKHRNVSSHVKGAVANEMLFVRHEGRKVFYSLQPEEVKREAFSAALWDDGDLVLRGVQINDDGSVTVTAEETARVKRLLMGAAV